MMLFELKFLTENRTVRVEQQQKLTLTPLWGLVFLDVRFDHGSVSCWYSVQQSDDSDHSSLNEFGWKKGCCDHSIVRRESQIGEYRNDCWCKVLAP